LRSHARADPCSDPQEACGRIPPATVGTRTRDRFSLRNFFDTLGIGSFAPTTAIFKFFKIIPDQLIPATLNVGHTLPTIAEAFIFTTVIAIDPTTLILMIAAAVLGAWLGAGIVASWPKRYIQIEMGLRCWWPQACCARSETLEARAPPKARLICMACCWQSASSATLPLAR
jgi:hypothetical protein